jgi:hypothetical protein
MRDRPIERPRDQDLRRAEASGAAVFFWVCIAAMVIIPTLIIAISAQ